MTKNKVIEFMEKISNKDGVVIIFNNDGDGICSCALFMKYLKKKGAGEPYIINQPMPVDQNIIKRIQTSLPNKIIFLDMAIDQQSDIIKKLKGIADILVIDHHQVHKDLNSENVVHHNPRLEDSKTYQSTTYLVYKLISQLDDYSDYLWIAAAGMISDYNLDYSKDVVEDVRKAYNVKEEKLYDSFLGRIADMIASTIITKAMSCEQIVHSLVKTESVEDFKAPALTESYKEIKNEMEMLVQDFSAHSEKYGDLILYNINSKYKLGSSLSTKVSEKHHKKTVIIYEIRGSKVKISGRNQSMSVNVGRLLGEACKGIKGAAGGGHEAAAGATVPTDHWEEFKERLIKLVNK